MRPLVTVLATFACSFAWAQNSSESKSFRIESDGNSESQHSMILTYVGEESNLLTLKLIPNIPTGAVIARADEDKLDLQYLNPDDKILQPQQSTFVVERIAESDGLKTYWLQSTENADDGYIRAVTVKEDHSEFALEYYATESEGFREKGDLVGYVTYYSR